MPKKHATDFYNTANTLFANDKGLLVLTDEVDSEILGLQTSNFWSRALHFDVQERNENQTDERLEE